MLRASFLQLFLASLKGGGEGGRRGKRRCVCGGGESSVVKQQRNRPLFLHKHDPSPPQKKKKKSKTTYLLCDRSFSLKLLYEWCLFTGLSKTWTSFCTRGCYSDAFAAVICLGSRGKGDTEVHQVKLFSQTSSPEHKTHPQQTTTIQLQVEL